MRPHDGAPADVGTPAVEATSLATQPWLVALVVVAWSAVGIGVASSEARRGHEMRHLVAIGLLLGPLLLGVARASLRRFEDDARPVRIREGTADSDSGLGVVVAVLGDPTRAADALPVLRMLAPEIGRCDVARPVTFDTARSADDQTNGPAGSDGASVALASNPGSTVVEAVADLDAAALLLDELEPGLLLLPGRGMDAVDRLIERQAADIVVVVDGERTTAHRVDVLVCRSPHRPDAIV